MKPKRNAGVVECRVRLVGSETMPGVLGFCSLPLFTIRRNSRQAAIAPYGLTHSPEGWANSFTVCPRGTSLNGGQQKDVARPTRLGANCMGMIAIFACKSNQIFVRQWPLHCPAILVKY